MLLALPAAALKLATPQRRSICDEDDRRRRRATGALSDYATKGLKEALVVKPVLALTPIKGGDWESVALATNPKFMAIIERSRKSRKPGLSTEEMRRRLGLKRRAG